MQSVHVVILRERLETRQFSIGIAVALESVMSPQEDSAQEGLDDAEQEPRSLVPGAILSALILAAGVMLFGMSRGWW